MDFAIIFWIMGILLLIMFFTGIIHNSYPSFANNQVGSAVVSVGDGVWKFLGYNMVKTSAQNVQINVPITNPTNTTIAVTGGGY